MQNAEEKKEGIREKLILLVATAALTGGAVPLIVNYMQVSWAAQQKLVEADLTRQQSLLKDQEELLKRVQKRLYDFHISIAKPAWYKYVDPNIEKYEEALADFDVVAWQFHSDMHQELTNVRRLAAMNTYREFENLVTQISALDNSLTALSVRTDTTSSDWEKLHLDANGFVYKIQDFIVHLAQDFALKSFDEPPSG